ncbi:MAG: peptide deformylase [Lentimicrobiaceae bacterium]|nr:peptide deformylase [Lentimicrobiaceae bacterium]
MILPIVAYGSPMLRKEAEDIDSDYPDLSNLVDDMFETMYYAEGVGLAAPQVGLSISLFVIDSEKMEKKDSDVKPVKKVFINPEIVELLGENYAYNEGCLSVPGINEDVVRKSAVRLSYQDINFVEHETVFTGMPARIILHEYDHLLGKVFVDKLSSLRKTLLRGKLRDITAGKADVKYKMKI